MTDLITPLKQKITNSLKENVALKAEVEGLRQKQGELTKTNELLSSENEKLQDEINSLKEKADKTKENKPHKRSESEQ